MADKKELMARLAAAKRLSAYHGKLAWFLHPDAYSYHQR